MFRRRGYPSSRPFHRCRPPANIEIGTCRRGRATNVIFLPPPPPAAAKLDMLGFIQKTVSQEPASVVHVMCASDTAFTAHQNPRRSQTGAKSNINASPHGLPIAPRWPCRSPCPRISARRSNSATPPPCARADWVLQVPCGLRIGCGHEDKPFPFQLTLMPPPITTVGAKSLLKKNAYLGDSCCNATRGARRSVLTPFLGDRVRVLFGADQHGAPGLGRLTLAWCEPRDVSSRMGCCRVGGFQGPAITTKVCDY